jgi:hypothetical protein
MSIRMAADGNVHIVIKTADDLSATLTCFDAQYQEEIDTLSGIKTSTSVMEGFIDILKIICKRIPELDLTEYSTNSPFSRKIGRN